MKSKRADATVRARRRCRRLRDGWFSVSSNGLILPLKILASALSMSTTIGSGSSPSRFPQGADDALPYVRAHALPAKAGS
jgi:hypothetical protein